MNPDAKFQQAIAQQTIWKSVEMQRFATALVEKALAKGGHFTTDIVPDDVRGEGSGIAGSVVELLKNAKVIQPVGMLDSGGQWYARRTKSTRPDRKSAWLNVYQLTSHALAQEFLRRHGFPPEPKQDEFTLV
jgi:hypothetical protein